MVRRNLARPGSRAPIPYMAQQARRTRIIPGQRRWRLLWPGAPDQGGAVSGYLVATGCWADGAWLVVLGARRPGIAAKAVQLARTSTVIASISSERVT